MFIYLLKHPNTTDHFEIVLALLGQGGYFLQKNDNFLMTWLTRLQHKHTQCQVFADYTYVGGTGNRFDWSFTPLTFRVPPTSKLALNESMNWQYQNGEKLLLINRLPDEWYIRKTLCLGNSLPRLFKDAESRKWMIAIFFCAWQIETLAVDTLDKRL